MQDDSRYGERHRGGDDENLAQFVQRSVARLREWEGQWNARSDCHQQRPQQKFLGVDVFHG